MSVVMKILDGPHEGKYLRRYDPNADDGIGAVSVTSDPALAMKFADPVAAWEEWKRPSTVHPIRLSDGKPNRPLTAWSITTENVDE